MLAPSTFPDMDPAMEKRLQRAATRAERAKDERDVAIIEAYLAGGGIREIARAVNLTHPAVKYILERNAENPAQIDSVKARKRALNEEFNKRRTPTKKAAATKK